MKNKKLILVLPTIISSLSLVACAEDIGEHSSSHPHIDVGDIVINNGEPVELLLDLNDLVPTTNTEATEQSPIVFRSIQDIADEFTAMFPNVTIKWAYSKKSAGDWAQWMTTQIASEDAPDIVMMHGSEYSDRDWYIPLDDILNEPNPFIEEGERGFERWKDQFPSYMWTSDMTCDATGSVIAIPITCYPGTATAYFYNKDIFEELNIEIPKNWEDFKNICKTINDAGYVAVAPWSLNSKANLDVWDLQFSLGPTYSYKIKDQWDYNHDNKMTQDELIRAVYEGVFYGQGQNRENLLSMLKEVKNKYNNILQVGAANTDYEPLWREGKVAMMEDGMWRLTTEAVNAERKFEYGIFATPLADSNTSEYCADFELGKGAYNPPIQDSFNICKDAVLQKGEGHFQASKYFLMWLSCPKNIDRMIDEQAGASIGAVYDSIIPEEIQDYLHGYFARTPACSWPTWCTVATQDKASRSFQYWISDIKKYDDNYFLSKYDAELHQGCLDMINALKIDTSSWTDGYVFSE